MATGRMEFTGAAPATGLQAGIGAADLSLTLLSGTGYPTGGVGKFVLALDPGITGVEEKVLCTARSGVTVTIDAAGRGYDNTVAQSHSAGTINVEHVVAATQLDDANAHTYVTSLDQHTQYARTDGSRAVTGTQSFVNTTNSGTLAVTGATTAAAITASGLVQAQALTSTLTGTNGRYVGTTAGAPSSGTYLTNDFATDSTNGTIWVCTAGGTPGTWVPLGDARSLSAELVRTTVQSIAANAYRIVAYDSAAYDPGSHVTTGAAAKYTVTVPGRYLITVSHSLPTGAPFGVGVFKNGTLVNVGAFGTGGPFGGSVDAVTVVRTRCVANDTLQGVCNISAASGSLNLDANAGGMTVDYLGIT